jgi:hypothetical protein
VQPLEPRRLLSAAIAKGVLVVEGTRRDDEITVRAVSDSHVRVSVNGDALTFRRKSFGRIRITAGRGDDSILFQHGGAAPDVDKPAGIDAGAGDDTVVGGQGDDTILGGAGDDGINGAKGNDSVSGGGGADFCAGHEGDDRLDGDNGGDTLRGDAGDDSLYGGRGEDLLREDAGTDRLRGGRDDDRFTFLDSRNDIRDETAGERIDPAPTPIPGGVGGGSMNVDLGAINSIGYAQGSETLSGGTLRVSGSTLTLVGGLNIVTARPVANPPPPQITSPVTGATSITVDGSGSAVGASGGGGAVIVTRPGTPISIGNTGSTPISVFSPLAWLTPISGRANAFIVPAGTTATAPDLATRTLAPGDSVTLTAGWIATAPGAIGGVLTVSSPTLTVTLSVPAAPADPTLPPPSDVTTIPAPPVTDPVVRADESDEILTANAIPQ